MKISMTDRRAYLLSVAVGASAFVPRFVEAAPSVRVYRIGVLDPNPEMFADEWKEFVGELSRLGYDEGRNLVFYRRFGSFLEPDLVAKFAAELVSLKVDLIFATHGTMSAIAAKNATKSIPIVFFSSGDPVGTGLVSSLSRPGGNLTGNSLASPETAAKSLQFLAEVVGRLRRVVELLPIGTRSLPYFPPLAAHLEITAKRLGVKYDYLDVSSMADVHSAIERLARENVDAITISYADWVIPHLKAIAALLIRYRIASIGDPDQGFLLKYSVDALQLVRKSAEYVDKILRGARPGELPVEQPSAFELAINQKTARAINLRISDALLLRANRVVQE